MIIQIYKHTLFNLHISSLNRIKLEMHCFSPYAFFCSLPMNSSSFLDSSFCPVCARAREDKKKHQACKSIPLRRTSDDIWSQNSFLCCHSLKKEVVYENRIYLFALQRVVTPANFLQKRERSRPCNQRLLQTYAAAASHSRR